MIIAIDTYYNQSRATTAIVAFENWTDQNSCFEKIFYYSQPVGDYVPGQFYQRELPPLLHAIESLTLDPAMCIVDGYVWLDKQLRPGLGAHLFASIQHRFPVIGVAKTEFKGAPSTEIYRGSSVRPLFVSAIGTDDDVAKRVRSMHGANRIPTLIKRADSLSRSR